jgi:anti-sigma factor RsiW
MNSSDRQDFDSAWLAYRYVSGELNGNELAEFEERLAVDQAARETVADVVDLCSALRALPKQSFESPPRKALSVVSAARIWPAVGWMALGAAACLALIVGLQAAGRGPGPQLADVKQHDATGDRRLALSWTVHDWTDQGQSSETDESAAGDESDSTTETSDNVAADTENESASSESPAAGGLELPGWVKAAIDESARPARATSTNREETP